MYLALFAAAIRLRYTHTDTVRPYRGPGGRVWGLWVVAGIGFITTLICFLIGFLPPGTDVDAVPYALAMLATLAVMLLVPQLLYYWRRPAWAVINTE